MLDMHLIRTLEYEEGLFPLGRPNLRSEAIKSRWWVKATDYYCVWYVITSLEVYGFDPRYLSHYYGTYPADRPTEAI